MLFEKYCDKYLFVCSFFPKATRSALKLFRTLYADLCETITDPVSLAARLYSKMMIKQSTRDKAVNQLSSPVKACNMLLLNDVETEIEQDESKLLLFSQILREDSDLKVMGDLLFDRLCEYVAVLLLLFFSFAYRLSYIVYSLYMHYYTLYIS